MQTQTAESEKVSTETEDISVKPTRGSPYSVLLNLIGYLHEYPYLITAATILVVIEKCGNVLLAIAFKELIDVLNSESSSSSLSAITLVIAYGMLRLFVPTLAELRDVLFTQAGEQISRRVAVRVLNHILALDSDFHSRAAPGGLSRDLDRGTAGVSFLLRYLLFNGIPTLIEVFLILGVISFAVSGIYAAIAAFGVIIYLVISFFANEWRTKFVDEVNKHNSAASASAIASITNHEVIKLNGCEALQLTKYDQAMQDWVRSRVLDRRTLALVTVGQALAISCTSTAMLFLAIADNGAGILTIGDFVMLTVFIAQLFAPLNLLGFVYREMRQALADVTRMYTILDKMPLVADRPGAAGLPLRLSRIEFNGVCFDYNYSHHILKDLTFSIEAGQAIAFVGPSGSGKSTIVKLLARLYDVAVGEIKINGNDLRSIKQSSLRDLLGIVSQETLLFSASIAENIAFGNPNADRLAIERAAIDAGLEQLVKRLPGGLDAQVGERGAKLSGGERQRIGIARAIIRKPQILVLDEATASLDYGTEADILRSLKAISKSWTTLTIAHRLTSVVDADRIYVLQEGRLVGAGTHQELLMNNRLYSDLWSQQNN